MAGPGIRSSRLPVSAAFLQRIRTAGAALVPFREPEIHPFHRVPSPRGLLQGWTPRPLRGIQRELQTVLWAPAWAENVAGELQRERADVVVSDFFLLGALAAAEASGVPAAALVHNAFPPQPTAGLPPQWLGLRPARGPVGLLRDWLVQAAVNRINVRDGLAPLNRARASLGLSALRLPFEQYDAAARVLVLGSRAFDFPARRLPPNVRYVGTPSTTPGPCRGILPGP